MAKRVKMSDIADRLKVSIVTVSKALSGQKGVSEEKREQIIQLAEQLGYILPVESKKKEKKSPNIGVLVVEAYIEKYVTFYWQMYQAVNTYAAIMDCFVMLEIIGSEDEKKQRLSKLVSEKRADGLIIMGKIESGYLKMLHENADIPLVYLDFYDGAEQDDYVISNSFYGSYTLTNYLFSMGHRDIAYVGSRLATDSIMDRYLGYLKSMLEHGVDVPQEWVIPDRDRNRKSFESIELPKRMPTAFVCNSDFTAGILIKSLFKKGYRVPDDISVVGYDDFIYPGLCEVEITTYSVDIEQMARSAVSILMKKLEGSNHMDGHRIIQGRLIIRDSVKRI